MTYASTIGNLLIAFGPALVFLFVVLGKKASWVLLAIGGSFCSVFALVFASVLWYVVVPLREVYAFSAIGSVLFCEAARVGFWAIWSNGRASLNMELDVGSTYVPRRLIAWEGLASGLGFFLGSSLVSYGGVVWRAWGAGTLDDPQCFHASLFFVSSLHTLLQLPLQLHWSRVTHVVFTDHAERQSLKKKSSSSLSPSSVSRRCVVWLRHWGMWIAVVVSHVLVTLASVLASGQMGSQPWLCLAPMMVQLMSIALFTYHHHTS